MSQSYVLHSLQKWEPSCANLLHCILSYILSQSGASRPNPGLGHTVTASSTVSSADASVTQVTIVDLCQSLDGLALPSAYSSYPPDPGYLHPPGYASAFTPDPPGGSASNISFFFFYSSSCHLAYDSSVLTTSDSGATFPVIHTASVQLLRISQLEKLHRPLHHQGA